MIYKGKKLKAFPDPFRKDSWVVVEIDDNEDPSSYTFYGEISVYKGISSFMSPDGNSDYDKEQLSDIIQFMNDIEKSST